MQTPREIYDCWKAVADKFKFLHQGTDDERREATKRGVQTIRARFRGAGGQLEGTLWVCKSQHNTGWSAQSKDALAFVEDGGPVITGRNARMSMFDMINGSSRETNPYPVTAHNHEEGNSTAYCLVPNDYDWLADGGTTPQPPDSTHKYDGGGNDTGICDVCGQDRHAAVHKIPAAAQPHAYDGGEQDTGLCDVCQKPLSDTIHASGITPVPPDSDLEQRVDALEDRVTVLESNPPSGVTEDRVRQLIAEALRPLGVEVASNSGFLGHSHKAVITGKL